MQKSRDDGHRGPSECVRDDGRVNRTRIIVAAVGDAGDDGTLTVSHALLRAGHEVVHLGSGSEPLAVARAAVAEDAERVVLVGADAAVAASVRGALSDLGAEDVDVAVS